MSNLIEILIGANLIILLFVQIWVIGYFMKKTIEK